MFGSDDNERNGWTTVSPVVVQAPLMTLDDHIALEKAPKLWDRLGWDQVKDIAGKVWNAPNTALGLLYGGAGMAVGEVSHVLGLQKQAPGVRWRDNAVQFTHNPLGGAGALTLGNSTTYSGDPYDPNDWEWNHGNDPQTIEKGHSIGEHEEQHTIQGQQLGPLYLPSNIAGGVMGLLFDRDQPGVDPWHGPHNWNERGPKANPPMPWAPRPK